MTLVVSIIFLVLSLWHVHMASSSPASAADSSAVPSVDGKPLFVPSRAATLGVACMLMLFALLIAATGKLLPSPVPAAWLSWACYALAAGLLLRAIGEFKYVGFFKRVKGTRFAQMDTLVYSPLCLVLALGVAWVVICS